MSELIEKTLPVLVGAAIATCSTWMFEKMRAARQQEAELYRDRVQTISDFAAVAAQARYGERGPVAHAERLARVTSVGARGALAFGCPNLKEKMIATVAWLESVANPSASPDSVANAAMQAAQLVAALDAVAEKQALRLKLVHPTLSLTLTEGDLARLRTGRYGMHLDLPTA